MKRKLKLKFCPECASMDIKSIGGKEQCTKCRYTGSMKWDSVDVINSYRKRVQSGIRPVKSKELENIADYKEESAEENNSQNLGSGVRKEKKPEIPLKERLKNLGCDDLEIM